MNLYSTSYPAVYRGIVKDNNDPENLGRCRVRVPSIHGDVSDREVSVLPWARPITVYPINSDRGMVNIPDVGDIVWVMFEASNREYPVYFGGTYGTSDIPVDSNQVDIYVESGNKITYNRSNQSYTFNVGENTINVSESGISISGETNIQGDLSVEGKLSVSGDASFSKDLYAQGTIICSNLLVNGSEWEPGGSLDLLSMDAMTEEELQEILDNIESNPDSFMYQVDVIKALMAKQGVTYDQSGYVTLKINGVDKKVRTDCSGLVSAMVSAYTGQDILMSSYGYVNATTIPGFSKVDNPTELKAGDICARNGHVEVYAYRKDGVDYVYSGGSTGSLNSAVPTRKGNGSYDVIWRPNK